MSTAIMTYPTETELKIQYDTRLLEAKRKAEQKLDRIIEREGDANGARREPWYLNALIEDALAEMGFTSYARKISAIYKEIAIEKKEKAASVPPQSKPFQVRNL